MKCNRKIINLKKRLNIFSMNHNVLLFIRIFQKQLVEKINSSVSFESLSKQFYIFTFQFEIERRGETISLEVYLIEPTSSIYSHIFNIYHNVSFEYVNKLSPILIRLKNEMRFSLQKSNRVNIQARVAVDYLEETRQFSCHLCILRDTHYRRGLLMKYLRGHGYIQS